MVYQLKPDPRQVTPARRLPGSRELEAQKPIKIKRDELPSSLGMRTRSMGLMMSVLGLATFFVPLINTSIPVLGRNQWSPLQIVEALIGGTLPPLASVAHQDISALYKLLVLDTFFFGAMFAYLALLVVVVTLLGTRSRVVIGFAAGLGLIASLVEMDGYADLRLALFGGRAGSAGGSEVMGLTWGLVLFTVFMLLVAIATIKELEAVPAWSGPR